MSSSSSDVGEVDGYEFDDAEVCRATLIEQTATRLEACDAFQNMLDWGAVPDDMVIKWCDCNDGDYRCRGPWFCGRTADEIWDELYDKACKELANVGGTPAERHALFRTRQAEGVYPEDMDIVLSDCDDECCAVPGVPSNGRWGGVVYDSDDADEVRDLLVLNHSTVAERRAELAEMRAAGVVPERMYVNCHDYAPAPKRARV